jgi:hypothetical protein
MNTNTAMPDAPGPAEPESPGFYAVIPATVRYDKNIPPGAKLLYGEITALCKKLGYCWTGNTYFADLYGVNKRTVTNWINALQDAGHITVTCACVNTPGSVEKRTKRIIRITGAGVKKFSPSRRGPFPDNAGQTPENSGKTPEKQRFAPEKRPFSPEKTAPQGEKIFTLGKFFPKIGKIFSKEGEKIFTHNSTSNKATATAAAAPPEKTRAPPPAEAAVAAPSNTRKLKDALAAVSRELVFDAAFYPRAASFMAANRLDEKYLSWLHAQCLAKKPRFLPGLFYKLFFAGNMLESFNVSRSPPPKPPAVTVICPACGQPHAKGRDCPACGLDGEASPARAEDWKRLFALPEKRRGDFLARQEAVLSEGGPFADFERKAARLAALRREFGLAPGENSS